MPTNQHLFEPTIEDALVVQGFQPIAATLESQLAEQQWLAAGVKPFVTNEVPYLVNNTGRASADAADVLFANCLDGPLNDQPIRVLELGSGLGLFARYFLDAFRARCQREGRDFYDRLQYLVSDRSPKTVATWVEKGLFEAHGPRVVLGTCDAMDPASFRQLEGRCLDPAPLRACFASYLLDVLPFAIVRRGDHGPEQLCVRTHLTNNAKLLPNYGRLTVERVRELASSADPGERLELLPLLNLFELDAAFLPAADGDVPYLQEALAFAPDCERVSVNHGAIQCLEAVLQRLDDDGFMLINDYGPVERPALSESAVPQRFGQLTAIGLNFPFVEHHSSNRGQLIVKAEGDEKRSIHSRLLSRKPLPSTSQAFARRYTFEAQEQFDAPANEARKHAEEGRVVNAVNSYRRALSLAPQDWSLLGQVAEVMGRLKDFDPALKLAQAALALNPWYSAWLFNVLGDCLFGLNRFNEAHAAYLQAQRIDPEDVRTNFNLSYTFLQFGMHDEALIAIAKGLAKDRQGAFRQQLLEKQSQILASLTGRWQAENEQFAKRNIRLS